MDYFRSLVTSGNSTPISTAKVTNQMNGWLSKWFWTSRNSLTITSEQVTDSESLDLILSNSKSLGQKVRRLKITETDIREIPVKIAYFINLTFLDLSCNKITDLPWSIVYLEQLTKLDLSYNELTLLPNTVSHLSSLQILRLQNNKLQTLPTSLIKLTRLREITLAENPLRSPGIDICLKGPQAIFQALSQREGRVNLWNNWVPWVSMDASDNQNESQTTPTLMELCITCVLIYDVDFLSPSYIPPRLKNDLTVIFSREFKHSETCVAKCGRCKNYFSNKLFFDTHMC